MKVKSMSGSDGCPLQQQIISLVEAGRTEVVESVLTNHPDLRNDEQRLLDCILTEFRTRESQGQTPQVDEYLQRFAAYASRLAPLLEGHVASRAVSEPDESFATRQSVHPTDRSTIIGCFESLPTGVTGTSAAVAPAPIGRVGDYDVIREIARGGMGVVYLARHSHLGRLAAVKLIRSGEFAGQQEVRRFQLEAEAAAKLEHPGIVSVYEIGQHAGQHFMAMAYVDGQSLWQRVKEAPLEPKFAARLMQQIAEAIQYAHSQEIIHRDLKPQNILLTKDLQPRVTDFGLAKNQAGDSSLTASGDVLGTPSYMPPEQATGNLDKVGALADVYSLGATLYCLLTGRPPFQAATTLETLKQVVEQEPVSPRMLNPSVDRDLETICLKCLEKSPANRFATAQDLADELARYLRGEPIRSRPVGPVARALRWCRRNPLGTALIGSVLVGVVALGISFNVFQQAQRAREISSLKDRLQHSVDNPELSNAYLELGENLIDQLDKLKPELSREYKMHLWRSYASLIERKLKASEITSSELQALEGPIDLLSSRAKDLSLELRDLLARRSETWQTAFQLEPPYQNLNEIFSNTRLKITDQSLETQLGSNLDVDAPVSTVHSRVTARGASRLEAVFDDRWRTARLLILELAQSEKIGYRFTLRPVPSTSASGKIPLNGEGASDEVDHKDFVVRIHRNGRVLKEQLVSGLSLVHEPKLAVSVARQGRKLSVQVGTTEPVRFEDPFPLSGAIELGFGIGMPDEVGLVKLTASQMRDSSNVTPLERGDGLYDASNWSEALTCYRDEALNASSRKNASAVNLVGECQYKQALCLMQMGRRDDATKILEMCFKEGSRWAAIAGVELWVQSLRLQRFSESDEVFEQVSSMTDSEVATMVSDEIRQEILRVYRERHPRRLTQAVSIQSSQIKEIWMLQRVRELLATSDLEQIWALNEAIDDLIRLGAYNDANILTVKRLKLRSDEEGVAKQIAILRGLGQPLNAINLANQHTFDEAGLVKSGLHGWLLLERIYCHAALQDWERVERELASLRKNAALHSPFLPSEFSWRVAMLQYHLLARRGDIEGARQVVHEALVATIGSGKRNDAGELEISNSEALLEQYILRGLRGGLTENEIAATQSKYKGAGGGPFGSSVASVISPESLVIPVNALFHSPKGLAWVNRCILDQGSHRDRTHKFVVRLAAEYLRTHAFGGNLSEGQERAVEGLGTELLLAICQEGKMGAPQFLSLGATWKGISSILGWKGVSSSLSPTLRQYFAYTFAHRYLSLNKLPQVTAFLEEACGIQDADPAIVSLARGDLELLKSRQGRLEIVNQHWHPVRVSLRLSGEETKVVEVAEKESVALPEGEYDLYLTQPISGVGIASSRITIKAGRHSSAAILSSWRPSSAEASLPGLVDRPAVLPGVCRWQMVMADSDNWTSFAISPDGKHVSIGDGEGIVRNHSLPDFNLSQLIPTDLGPVTSMDWNTSGETLAIAGWWSPKICLWNHSDAKMGPVLKGHLTGVTCLAWKPNDNRLASGGDWGDTSIRIWDPNQLGNRTSAERYRIRGLAWNADGRRLAMISELPTIKILSDELNPLVQFETSGKPQLFSIAWRPREKVLAAGCANQSTLLYSVIEDRTSADPTQVVRDTGIVSSMSWDRDGKRLLMGRIDGGVQCYSIESKGATSQWNAPQSGAWPKVAWLPPEDQMAVTLLDSHLRTWDNAGKCVGEHVPAMSLIASVEFAPGMQLLSGRASNGAVGLYDMSGRVRRRLPNVVSRSAPSFSPDGKTFAVTDDVTQRIQIHDIDAVNDITQLDEPAGHVRSLTWSKTGRLLAVCMENGSVWVCSIDKSMAERLPLKFLASDIAWKPDGSQLAIAANHAGAQVIFWDLNNKSISKEVQVSPQPGIRQLEWSPDGRKLAVVHSVIQILAADGQRGTTITPLPPDMQRIRWSEDGQSLAAVGADRKCHVWSADGTEIRTITAGSRSQVVALTVGNELLLWSRSGLERRSVTTTDQLQRLVMWPDGESIELRNSGEVMRSTSAARNRVRFVVELPGQRLETWTWQQFEKCIGMPLGGVDASADEGIDYERKVAEWAIGWKADIQIETAVGLQKPTDLSHLPAEAFHVRALYLDKQKNLSKRDLASIGQLKRLKVLSLKESSFDDSVISTLENLTQLPQLST